MTTDIDYLKDLLRAARERMRLEGIGAALILDIDKAIEE